MRKKGRESLETIWRTSERVGGKMEHNAESGREEKRE